VLQASLDPIDPAKAAAKAKAAADEEEEVNKKGSKEDKKDANKFKDVNNDI
jgi:hypothetical protein